MMIVVTDKRTYSIKFNCDSFINGKTPDRRAVALRAWEESVQNENRFHKRILGSVFADRIEMKFLNEHYFANYRPIKNFIACLCISLKLKARFLTLYILKM